MKIKPLNGNIVLKYKEEENTTKEGIILNLDSQKQDSVGVVVCFDSEDDKIKKSGIKLNDNVIYKNYSGTKSKIEGQEYLIVKFEDILAILNHSN
ncbi:co-chaperone GroES [Candidatus Phytoplasma pini]|uniref:10 kDa chaperonin n=1 Tax=Candidatus Phytoplasma pini TaxID=267362 RepID=A0A559KJW4_9MOLU|nr:co-chaperone GroES [Candidatus Phytoplasma pini]TVY12420.1 chaperonin 10kDa, small subunit [Candidatus Phytoplasma pini]